MASRPVASAPPPFYWKVPVPEKDYMSENYRRIRQIANQAQKKRSEPLKAAFIPGVTKNDKYAHVSSRVGEFLKTKKGSDVTVEESKGSYQRKPTTQNQLNIDRRLSRSSTDLRQLRGSNQNQPQSKDVSQNTFPRNRDVIPTPVRTRRCSEESFNSHQESVYNWRLKDDLIQPAKVVNAGASVNNGYHNSIPTKYCHRVEYLPCDGICADENFVVDDTHPDSARSGSSCRTSRGCNTEETRILEDPTKSYSQPIIKQVDSGGDFGSGDGSQRVQMPKSRSVLTLPSQDNESRRKQEAPDWFQTNTRANTALDGGAGRANSTKVFASQKPENGRIKTSLSSTSLRSAKQSETNGVGGGGDFPHTLGSVPKYLKQRQEEWKSQEKERKEAEINANVPYGYVLLSDEERDEHLRRFKRNYDMLINELNRIPIRIDTIRVKEHKIQLEQQLTRLEEAMKTFSRPRVWVKVDD